jgi:hypothetical protein
MSPIAIAADERVKQVLDNCRLDYLFEPAWDRLLERACDLLQSAKTVAWCQAGEGDLPVEGLVLADPGARFVRDNVNGFLLGRDVGCPLPLVCAEECPPLLGGLLRAWRARTGAQMLVGAAFLRDRSAPVIGPRMAVQAFYSSAIDALVVGRFLLMKDYWLMRMPGQTMGGATT